jgi:thiol-disulfide isomerase/thioredoxin
MCKYLLLFIGLDFEQLFLYSFDFLPPEHKGFPPVVLVKFESDWSVPFQGDEFTLATAVNLLHANKDDYIAVLFYASWCPFSQECKPNFETLASLFPTIRHFAFEESAIRPRFVLV